MAQYMLLKNCSQVLTCPEKGLDLGLLENTSVLIKEGIIEAIGSYGELSKNISTDSLTEIDCSGKVVLPGFVDAHTHLVFGGDRLEEYVASLPSDPEEAEKLARHVTKRGLAESMELTRKASFEELTSSSLKKLEAMKKNGTTTVEIKSGYGIDLETELKQLQVIAELQKLSPLNIIPTYLGAHYWDTNMGKDKYIDFMLEEVMPKVARDNLAEYADVWVDEGYYTAKEAEKIISKAMELGMKGKLHTDAYSDIGGSLLAAEMQMTSADHLNYTTLPAMNKMAQAGVTGVLLPGTDFALKHPKPFNPLPMKKSGMKLALATNLNPGNYMLSMPFVMILATRLHGMSPEDAIRSTTINGAFALDREKEIGSIEKGKKADIQIWDTHRYENIFYQYGANLIDTVIKSGKIISKK